MMSVNPSFASTLTTLESVSLIDSLVPVVFPMTVSFDSTIY